MKSLPLLAVVAASALVVLLSTKAPGMVQATTHDSPEQYLIKARSFVDNSGDHPRHHDSSIDDRASIDPTEAALENEYSFCSLQRPLSIPHFRNKDDVYVAHGEDQTTMGKVLQSMRTKVATVEEIVSVVGGMSTLHILPLLDEVLLKKLHWIDVNCHALDNGQLILALIKTSNGRRDFLSRLFARDLDKFLSSRGYRDLDLTNQNEYMEMTPDDVILTNVLASLPRKLRIVYLQNVVPRAHIGPLPTTATVNQHVVLPMADDLVGPLTRFKEGVVNKGSFDYGFGYLENDAAFNKTKRIVEHVRHSFKVGNLVDASLSSSFLTGESETILYASNIFLFVRADTLEMQEMIIRWWKPFLLNGKFLHIVSAAPLPDLGLPGQSHYHVRNSIDTKDPHLNAFYALTSVLDVGSNLVEIMKKDYLPGGMREFPRTAVSVETYLAMEKCEARTTMLHILVGEGAIGMRELVELFHRAMKQSLRVIVMEWDAESADHRDKQGLLVPRDLIDAIGEPLNQFHIPGVVDRKRIFVFEYRGHLKPSLFYQPTCSVV